MAFGKRKTPPPGPEDAPLEPATEPAASVRTHYFMQTSNEGALADLEDEIDKSIEDGATEILIVLTSPGGSLLPMLEFYRKLVALPVKLRTHAVGPVASAGTILMLAGAERSAEPTANFMFHPVSMRLDGPVDAYQSLVIERRRQLFELTMHNIYRERTRFDEDTIARFGREELWFDVSKAIECGVIDRIERVAVPSSWARHYMERVSPEDYCGVRFTSPTIR
jgi:ATP-dependent protease ClpP protease subunit